MTPIPKVLKCPNTNPYNPASSCIRPDKKPHKAWCNLIYHEPGRDKKGERAYIFTDGEVPPTRESEQLQPTPKAYTLSPKPLTPRALIPEPYIKGLHDTDDPGLVVK